MNRQEKLQINLFYIVTILFWSSLYTYQPTMSPYLKSINVSYSMIGVIGGVYGFTQMLIRIPLGILSDKLGMRKAFIISGVFTSVLSSLILYLTDSPPFILIGRGLAGVAASSWVIFTVLFSSYFTKDKSASRLSFLSMCNNFGQVAAMLAGSVCAGYLGYKFPFLLGIMAGTAGFIFSFFIKENVPSIKKPPHIKDLISVSKNKNLIVMSALAVLSQIVLFGSMNTFTPMVAVNLNASSSELGYLSTLSSIPRILSAMLCGILLGHKINIKKLMVISFILLTAGITITPFCPDMWSLYIISIITGFGSGISMTMLLSLCIRDIADEHRSTAMGFFQAIYGIGMFIGPIAVGIITDRFGLSWGFAFSALASFAGIIGSIQFIENDILRHQKKF